MLTDYHLHLRPDEDGTTSERYFTAENVDRYLAAAAAKGIGELGVSEHVYRFRQALELWQHPLWLENANDDLDEYCEFVPQRRCGWASSATSSPAPRRAPRRCWRRATSTTSSARSTSSATATPPSTTRASTSGTGASAEEIWQRYFDAFGEAARSGLFDILAHPDLVKVWGRERPLPEGDLRRFYEPAVEAIVDGGAAVELSTAGLRKPVGELYPARAFAELCVEAGAPFALSSDAHLPEQVGFGYDQALAFLDEHRGRARSPSSRAAGAGSSRSVLASAPVDGRRRVIAVIGIGYDSHRFEAGRPLILGGVEIDHPLGLAGPLRRRRPHPRGDRRDPRRRRRWRHRHALPRHRRALGRRRFNRPAGDGDRDDRRRRRQRRCDRDLRGAEARPLQGRDGDAARRGDRVAGQRQGDDQRGDGLDRPRRGDRLHRRRPGLRR